MTAIVALEAPTAPKPLRFKVAPHIVQDLGLNLYTNLPRVLVEFVANAYDADSAYANVAMDQDAIRDARVILKKEWELARAKGTATPPLEEVTLPDDITITIEDAGHGMAREDLEKKFLVAGRRRRDEEASIRTANGRLLMGRKGLGKLAGFGVAHRVEVITRKSGEPHATKIRLEYEELIKNKSVDEIEIPDEVVPNGGGLPESGGTRIVLSRLVYEPMKTGEATLAHAIADHFALIDTDDFAIRLNNQVIEPTPRKLVYAYPEPDRDVTELVNHQLVLPDDRTQMFSYRIRFTEKSLPARQRGVRVYAHKRLASAPDLLDLPTGMHGFRMTDYLDGIVHADFVDEQPTEYIATDRQSLRWEVPLLTPLREFLSDEMRKACTAYQKYRDEKSEKDVSEDTFTTELVESLELPQYKKKVAYELAGKIASLCQDGKESDEYKERVQIFLDGLGQGTLLRLLGDLAQEDKPDINRLVAHVTQLASRELGEFVRFAHGRIFGIEALRKICMDVNFKAAKNEKELHDLFKTAPWLINATFAQFLTSNQRIDTTFEKLAEVLGIDDYGNAANEPARISCSCWGAAVYVDSSLSS
ncbi:MAG TPA: ATP-binding protein [Thermoanaerobaculia bacterium]|nr:ATP-binding protein [Thermoanaerobaculia bacterium]